MQVILLERVDKLGSMGQIVGVRDGYARNFLIPQGKALRATKASLDRFEQQRAELEARNLQRRQEAEALSGDVAGRSVVVIRQAGESGILYGSVSARDVVEAFAADGLRLDRGQVRLEAPIKQLGLHTVSIALHPEVAVDVTVNIARSRDEADIQAGLAEAPVDGPAEGDEVIEGVDPEVESLIERGFGVDGPAYR
ncbi:50S ribosomal protein L9 [Marinivivus vitaminiproducens]|uniref:50S ribosomal protein L9 n=1 Tax=Marinivivus vitaminiproducens TaxID=3035935 RepID=UPI0027A21AD0|nr:50S ribosomal protein L9 [Geminicoccaceae bacterium SCSIO 64248]